MYFVDRKKIEELLSYMEMCVDTFETYNEWDHSVRMLALERLAQVLIESTIDVGNQLIDGFVMRDPGGYSDIIEILYDENVLTKDDADSLKAIIEQRKQLVRSYTTIDHGKLYDLLDSSLPALKAFPPSVRRYLNEELGPVSAFLPENKEETNE